MVDEADLIRRIQDLETRLARVEDRLTGQPTVVETDLDTLDAGQLELVEQWRTGDSARDGLLDQYKRKQLKDLIAKAHSAAARHRQLSEQLTMLQHKRQAQSLLSRRQDKQNLESEIRRTTVTLHQQWDGTGRYSGGDMTVEAARGRLAQDTELRGDRQHGIDLGHKAVSELREIARARIVDMVTNCERPPRWFSVFLGDEWPHDQQEWVNLATKVVMLRWYAGITDPIVAIGELDEAHRPTDYEWSDYALDEKVVRGRQQAQEASGAGRKRDRGLSM